VPQPSEDYKMNNRTLEDCLTMEIDTRGLTPAQVRLIRSINSLLLHVMKTSDESEFFDGSAEFMRLCASLIKQSFFANQLNANEDISYAAQALEYSMDMLQEFVEEQKVVQYDN